MNTTQKQPPKKKKPAAKKKTVKRRKINAKNMATIIVSVIVVLGLIGGSAGMVMIGSMIKDAPKIDINNFESKESTQILDKDGNLIQDIGQQIRTNVSYEDMPTSLVDAFVAVEDSRYFEHNGFDLPRFAKAFLTNLKTLSFSQGGSTFTMQLVKNTYFTNDETGEMAARSKLAGVKRKVQEIFLAMQLEKQTNKKRIFELYLNKLNFGGSGNIRGVQKAAEYYFGKDVSELNLSESALLAGIINRPNAYNPFKNLDYATDRRNTVLNLMQRHGYITKQEAELAKSIKIEDQLVDSSVNKGSTDGGTPYQSYVDAVIAEAKELTGMDPTVVPMKIYTSMDPEVQTQIDDIQAGKTNVEFPDDLMEIAIVSMNNQTGEIVGIGGGRNYAGGGSLLLNHATDQYKQPGSAVKPFLSYALAFENLGWSTSHTVTDAPFNYAGTTKVVKNFNGRYYGDIPLEYAVGNSLNTPALKTLQEVIDAIGSKKVVQYLQNLGFSRVTQDEFNVGYAIGGSTYEASTVEMAGAHATMINGGSYIKPHTITKIEFKDGTSPVVPDYSGTQVISAESAYLASHLMYQAVYGPYSNYMQILKRGYPIYGKTGTTDWGSDGLKFGIPQGAAKDKWMIASSSKYTNAVWVGYEKGIKDKKTYFDSQKSKLNIPGNISKLMLDVLHKDEENPPAITQPDGVTSITHIKGLYPYTAVLEGMDGSFVTTGMIKKEFNKLADPLQASVQDIGTFDASLSTDGNLHLTWGDYPDASKLTVAPNTKNLGIEVGGKWYDAPDCAVAFDWTWVYGPIRYKAQVSIQDFSFDVTSEQSSIDQHIDVKPGDKVNVCGYYAYENMNYRSNEICKEIQVEDKEIQLTIPSDKATKAEIESWASANGVTVSFTEVADEAKKGTNEIISNGAKVNGTTMTFMQSTIGQARFAVTLYVGLACGDNASVVNGACACNQGYEGDPIKGCTAKPAPTPDPTPSTDPSPDTSPSPDPTPSEDTQDQNDENKD